MTNIRIFYLKICQFFVVKFSIYLNRRVFVMIEKQAYGSYFLIDKLYFFPYYERSTNFCVTDVSIRQALLHFRKCIYR